eukprot:1810273-Rhodomonas_salina.1
MEGLNVSPCGDPRVVGMRAVSPISVLIFSHVSEYSSLTRMMSLSSIPITSNIMISLAMSIEQNALNQSMNTMYTGAPSS